MVSSRLPVRIDHAHPACVGDIRHIRRAATHGDGNLPESPLTAVVLAVFDVGAGPAQQSDGGGMARLQDPLLGADLQPRPSAREVHSGDGCEDLVLPERRGLARCASDRVRVPDQSPQRRQAAETLPGDDDVAAANADRVLLGPRGSKLVPERVGRLAIVADETAFPAAARWLRLAPPSVPVGLERHRGAVPSLTEMSSSMAVKPVTSMWTPVWASRSAVSRSESSRSAVAPDSGPSVGSTITRAPFWLELTSSASAAFS